ncbi:MAG: hypothetical protein GY928_21930 [Colwellia sp.]|nr:hypothetical protein [Colwellia sp.]
MNEKSNHPREGGSVSLSVECETPVVCSRTTSQEDRIDVIRESLTQTNPTALLRAKPVYSKLVEDRFIDVEDDKDIDDVVNKMM